MVRQFALHVAVMACVSYRKGNGPACYYIVLRSGTGEMWQVAFGDAVNPYPTAFPYGNGMVLHFYQQQESSTTKIVHKVINKGLKTYV